MEAVNLNLGLTHEAAWQEAENLVRMACRREVASLAEVLESYCKSLQRAYAHQVAQLSARSRTGCGTSWDSFLRLVQVMQENGFGLAQATAQDLVWERTGLLEVWEFVDDGRFFRWPRNEPYCVVNRLRLIVQPPPGQGFNRWRCLAETTGPHPNVNPSTGEVCVGDLRGRDLLEPDTLPTLLRNLAVPNLGSAYHQVPRDDLVPLGRSRGGEYLW